MSENFDDRVRHLLDQVAVHHQGEMPLLNLTACCLDRAPVAMLAELTKEDEQVVLAALARLRKWNLVDFDGETADLHALLRQYLLGQLDENQSAERRTAIARWFAARPPAPHPRHIEQVTPLLRATQQALLAHNEELASDLLYGTRVGEHYPTLDGWLRAFGHLARSVELQTGMVDLYEGLVAQGRHELTNALAMAYNNRGNARGGQGDLAGAVADYDKAIEIGKQLVQVEGRDELRNNLANSYNNRGNARRDQGDLAGAVEDYDKAIEIGKQLVQVEGRDELRNNLASAYNNRGNARGDQGDLAGAVEDYDKAIEIGKQLVKREGGEVRNDLAMVYNNRGIAHGKQGDQANAVRDFDKAIEIREQLVKGERREELRNDLAVTYNNRGIARGDQRDLAGAVEDYDKAIDILEQLVQGEGREELRNDLARAYGSRGQAHAAAGKRIEPIEDARRCATLFADLVAEGYRHMLPNGLKGASQLCEAAIAADASPEAAEWAGRAAGMLAEAVEDGQVSEVLKPAAAAFYARLRPHVPAMAAAGLDVAAFTAAGKALGIIEDDYA